MPQIYDGVRKKFVALTPEEWVRQHLLHFLAVEKKFPVGLIQVETALKTTKGPGRTDLKIFNNQGQMLMVAECKSPFVQVTENALLQLSVYNYSLKAPWILLTNGLEICCASVTKDGLEIVPEVPLYSAL